MKALFLVGTKILGLVSIFRGLLVIPTIAMLIGQLNISTSQPEYSAKRFLVLSIVNVSFYILFGLLLVFRTTQLANLLGIKDDSNQQLDLGKTGLFKIGLNILGIYILATKIPLIAGTFYKFRQQACSVEYVNNPFHGELISYGLQILFGIVLVFSGSRIVSFISEKEIKSSRPTSTEN